MDAPRTVVAPGGDDAAATRAATALKAGWGVGSVGTQVVLFSQSALFGALVLISLGYSAFNIPYLAMSAEMTDSPVERTSFMSWRIAFVGVGTIIATSALPLVARSGGGGVVGYSRVGLVAGALVLLAMGMAFVATRGARATESRGARHSAGSMFAAVAANRAFAWLLGAKLLQLVGLAASSASMLYFVRAVLGAVSNGVSILSMPAWTAIGRRWGKVALYALSVVGFAAVGFTWLLADATTSTTGIVLRAACSGVFVGGMLLMGQALIPDVIALDHARSGLRREGVFAGAYSFVEKASSAIGPMIVGTLFQVLGFARPGDSSPGDVQAVYLAAAVLPPTAYLLSAAPVLMIGRRLRVDGGQAWRAP